MAYMTRLASCAALALAVSGNAHAAITIYTDQASFLAAISAPATDTFEDLSRTGTTASPLARSVGAYSYTATVRKQFVGAGTGSDHWLSSNTPTETITLSRFTGGVFGVGGNFFGSDIQGQFAKGGVRLSATDSDGTVTRFILNASTTSFLGFLSNTGVTSVSLASIRPESGVLWPTANNLILGGQATVPPAIPEPATWAMMIAGFGLIGAAMRRKTVAIRFA